MKASTKEEFPDRQTTPEGVQAAHPPPPRPPHPPPHPQQSSSSSGRHHCRVFSWNVAGLSSLLTQLSSYKYELGLKDGGGGRGGGGGGGGNGGNGGSKSSTKSVPKSVPKSSTINQPHTNTTTSTSKSASPPFLQQYLSMHLPPPSPSTSGIVCLQEVKVPLDRLKSTVGSDADFAYKFGEGWDAYFAPCRKKGEVSRPTN